LGFEAEPDGEAPVNEADRIRPPPELVRDVPPGVRAEAVNERADVVNEPLGVRLSSRRGESSSAEPSR